MLASKLEKCCNQLESTRVMERKKGADELPDLMEDLKVIRFLNANKSWWDVIVRSVHELLVKESAKLLDDEQKKKGINRSNTSYTKRSYGDLLIMVIRKANTNMLKLDASKLVDHVLNCFNTTSLKQYFSKTYISILKDSILSVKNYCSEIRPNQWMELLYHLKQYHHNRLPGVEELKPLHCLQLLFHWGPLHSMPGIKLRQEFSFITQIAQQVTTSSKRGQQEVILKILLEFSHQTAGDNRMACCTMGEKLFTNFIGVYQLETQDEIKILLLEFFLMQVQIHHPNGAVEGSISAYACSWEDWNKQLQSLYSVLCDQVNNNLHVKFKPLNIFGGQYNNLDVLHDTFVNLLVAIFKQVFYCRSKNQDQSILEGSISTQPVAKKRKVEGGIPLIISNIQERKQWPWINVIAELLRKYPDTIIPDDFVSLLRLLSTLQAECKFSNVSYHLYECLIVLADVETHIDLTAHIEVVNSLWSVIAECTLRAIGLNQNEDKTHKLLQKLIAEHKPINSKQLLQTYVSQVVNVTPCSLQTLNIGCAHFGLLEANTEDIEDKRKTLMKWIVNMSNEKFNNINVYSSEITSQILLSLSLRKWNTFNSSKMCTNKKLEKSKVEYIYEITFFDKMLVLGKDGISENKTDTNYMNLSCCQTELFNYLLELICELVAYVLRTKMKTSDTVRNACNIIALIGNILTLMIQYNLLEEDNLNANRLTHCLTQLLEQCCNSLCSVLDNLNEKHLNQIIVILNYFNNLLLLDFHESIMVILRRNISITLLQKLFRFFNEMEENEEANRELKESEHFKSFVVKVVSVLSNFSYFPNTRYVFEYQQNALEALVSNEFDPKDVLEYEKVLTFLHSLKRFKIGSLSDNILSCVLKSIQRICEIYYKSFDTALNILEILHDLYPHIASLHNNSTKENSMILLQPFYTERLNYGSPVLVAIINCLGQLFKFDFNDMWTRWQGDREITIEIAEFLSNDFQEVRLAAIENLNMIFSKLYTKDLEVTRQNAIFNAICIKTREVFDLDVNGTVSAEQRIDETVTRTASALHTFASIATCSTVLRQKALFTLLQLVKEKELNIDSTISILKMVAKQLNKENLLVLLETNLEFLVSCWYDTNKTFNNFPYILCGCNSLMEFYIKYTSILVPSLISNDLDLLKSICNQQKESLENIMKASYPGVVARCLLIQADNNGSNELLEYKTRSLENLHNIFGEAQLNELLLSEFDTVVKRLLQLCFDPKDIRTRFSFAYGLPEPHSPYFTVDVILRAVHHIQENYLNNSSLVFYCANNFPDKLQKMFLHMVSAVYTSITIEEKMVAFHQFVVFIDLIIPLMKQTNNLKVYFIRSVSYTLINLIKNDYEDDSIVNITCCKYFAQFLSDILPENAEILNKFIVTFVSILVPIAKTKTTLGTECIKLLDLLIVQHADDLNESIKMLDPFPNDEDFLQMQYVYKKAKYNSIHFTLQEEIEHFLSTSDLMGSSGYRTEGLKYLKCQLSNKKVELKDLYSKLNCMRGFSEDCEKSIVHRLICVLVRLSLSSNSSESVEALRCLGELGSADVLTTILQSEQMYEQKNFNFSELVTGSIVALLVKYIVDKDVEVMTAASQALYFVLEYKEAKSVLDSQIDYGYGLIENSYIIPFISSRKLKLDFKADSNFKDMVNVDDLWCPITPMEHTQWITNLISTILQTFTDKSYLRKLIPLCKTKVEFSERIFPLLIYIVLTSGFLEVISAQIRRFFSVHWNLRLQEFQSCQIATNKLSVQCMLNVVHFIRLHRNIENKRHLENLQLNYLHVAHAAQFCTAHFTALLYIELWCQERLNEIRMNNTLNHSVDFTSLDIILEHEEPVTRQAIQNIFRKSYKEVGEYDVLHACESLGFLENNLKVEHYEHLQKWEQAALFYDIQISQGNTASVSKLLGALKNCGLYQLPLKWDHFDESQYECAWRLSNWNINRTDCENSDSYEKYKYFTIKALHEDDANGFNSAIDLARRCVVKTLQHVSLESSKNLFEPMSKLQSLLELEDFMMLKNEGNVEVLLKKWEIQDDINRNDFQYVEPIYVQRIVILNDLVKYKDPTLKDALVDMHLKFAGLARTEGKQHAAYRTLEDLLHINNLTPLVQNRIRLEEAQLCWIDNKTRSRYILRNLLSQPNECQKLHAAALKLYGTWMVETSSENPKTIIIHYFLKSIDILKKLENTEANCHNIFETYDVLARFSDLQYQQPVAVSPLLAPQAAAALEIGKKRPREPSTADTDLLLVLQYITSSVFENKVEQMEKSKEIANNIRKHARGKLKSDEMKAALTHERQSAIDKNEIDNVYTEKNIYLKLAMKYYIGNIQHTDENNLRMFRILSLWLENRTDTEITTLLETNLSKIPSYKYIPILPQVIPHVTNNSEDIFGNQINQIVERCAKDHPHHTLPVILALANNKIDRDISNSTANTTTNELRIAGAQKIIENLKKEPHLKQLIIEMEKVLKALVQLAYVNETECRVVNEKKKIFAIPHSCLITKIKNLDQVLLPTYTLPIKQNCDYSDIIGINCFDKNFANVGGLNAPKRITCIGTDGIKRIQLVKGKDDLRQDAVMQQVFNIMNELLRSNKQTCKLLIRTYKIVPLSQRSGILEWVENSVSLSEYLIGEGDKSGAHQIHNPNDIKPSECRREFACAAKTDNDGKLEIYKNICKRFQPVFHKFFETSFVQPAVWYERRRAYIFSVATSSMCGYILGLGDRHVQNILIDLRTAEVIHIDFGIAFEQGLVLPTQETVPFRLTRDIEAGMGITGVEGVFRKSCERTLEVLRKNSETIITILEVLLYDPLYTWTVTPAQAYKRQREPDESNATIECNNDQENIPINKTAERALLRLRQKLQSTTEGGASSIEGQVEKLIQQARDPFNLCRLFQGWQPYL